MELRKQLTEEYHYATERVTLLARPMNGGCSTMQRCAIRRGGAKARETEVDKKAKMAKNDVDSDEGNTMQSMSAKDAKYGFGRLIDLARSEPVVVNKHGRPVVVVLAVEEFERLRVSANGAASQPKEPGAKRTAKRRSTERA
ncbi:MAG: type II toxin-antitoxin system Phd/YefM family antitoxin [Methylocella sp.]